MNNRDNIYGIMLLILVELLLISTCIRSGPGGAVDRQANWSSLSGHVAWSVRK